MLVQSREKSCLSKMFLLKWCVFNNASCVALGMVMSEYLHKYLMDDTTLCTAMHGPQRITYNFIEPLTFTLAPPADLHLCF